MPRFKPLVLLLIISSVSLAWFVISGPQNNLPDRGNLPDGSIGNARALLPVPQIPHPSAASKADTDSGDRALQLTGEQLRPSAAPKADADRPDSLGVVGGSLLGEKTETNPATPLISLKAGLLSVALEDRPLRWVLDEISRQSGMMFETVPEISEQRVTDAFQDLPIERGLRHLLSSWDLFFFYGGDETGPQYVWVYPKGKGVELRPIPPEVWASTLDLEEAFNDTDPQVRTQALQALVERKGKAALELLLPALDDPNDQIRSGALNAAATSNLEIAPETLIGLVQNDPSPTVRFLALAAISSYMEAPPADLDIMGIAIDASADADPEIRTLAENLIDRLEAEE